MKLSFTEKKKTNRSKMEFEVRSLVLRMFNIRRLKLGKQLDLQG